MKSEDLNVLEEEIETVSGKLQELREEELEQVAGGWGENSPIPNIGKEFNNQSEADNRSIIVFP